ncbi:MAG TPA: hypothetical protein VN380_25105 [Thermoanaerobaculia bacterium]|jgi:hypothetical protein|nr:hypothetical protein [Thermoanaerobaculia bacterium]
MDTGKKNPTPSEASSIGFCSEHTTEYVLVPQLRALLESNYAAAIPVFIWFTREGARGCSSFDGERLVKLAAVFPRRPKVHSTWQETIVVKINEELFEYAACAEVYGIVTLAGVPLASSLFHLTSGCKASWFALSAIDSPEDQFVRLKLLSNEAKTDARGIAGPLTDEELINHINLNAQVMSWSSAIAALREVRRSVKRARYPWWAAGYKPFLMLISEDPVQPPRLA